MRRLDPSDPAQLRAWASSLARTATAQRAIIRDLLRHARGDHMSEIDRRFCRAALQMLDGLVAS